MNTKNRAKDGFSNEKDFVKKLNSNKNHRYWKILNLTQNKDLFFVKVEGKKLCKTTNKSISPKTDVYVSKINIDKKELEKKNFYISENTNLDFSKFIKNSGISIKMRNTNYQIDKCSIDTFVKRYGSKELFAGATIYSKKIVDLSLNHKVLEASNTSWKEFSNYFKESSLEKISKSTIFNEEHKKLFGKIQKYSYGKIKSLSLKNEKILNSLFKGHEDFDDPFYATWLLINDELTQKIPTNFYVTKGSTKRLKKPPTVVFKPLR